MVEREGASLQLPLRPLEPDQVPVLPLDSTPIRVQRTAVFRASTRSVPTNTLASARPLCYVLNAVTTYHLRRFAW